MTAFTSTTLPLEWHFEPILLESRTLQDLAFGNIGHRKVVTGHSAQSSQENVYCFC